VPAGKVSSGAAFVAGLNAIVAVLVWVDGPGTGNDGTGTSGLLVAAALLVAGPRTVGRAGNGGKLGAAVETAGAIAFVAGPVAGALWLTTTLVSPANARRNASSSR
jgi:hypothetical protein